MSTVQQSWRTARRLALVAPPLIGAIALLLRHWHGAAVWQLALVAGAPYLMLVTPVGVISALASRSWKLAAVSTAVMVACANTQVWNYWNAELPVQPERLHVMTQNADLGRASATEILDAVRRRHVDALVVTELTPELRLRLHNVGLDRELPFNATAPTPAARGTGIWSRNRLHGARVVRGYSCAFVTATTDFAWHNGPTSTRLVGLHLIGPTWDAAAWRRDADRLPGTLKRFVGEATIVAGDFNATPDSPWLRDALDSGFSNASASAGAGLVRTYPSDHPLLAIDHVLISNLTAVSVKRVSIAGTDHLGIIATVASPIT